MDNTQIPATVMLNFDSLPFMNLTLLPITKMLLREVQIKLNFLLQELTSERHYAAPREARSDQFLAT